MPYFNQTDNVFNQTGNISNVFPRRPVLKQWVITPEWAVKISAYSIILSISIIANALILYSVKRNANKRMRSSSNYVLVSLSISNLIITIICVPRTIETYVEGSMAWSVPGAFGLYLCKVTYFLADQGIAASFLATVALSFDWFLAVVFPLKKRMNTRITRFSIILTWILATAYAVPILYSAYFVLFRGVTFCFKGEKKIPGWSTLKIVLLGPLPLALVVILNSAVIIKLWCRHTPGEQSGRGSFRRARDARTRRTNRKAFRLLLAVIVVYYVCFLPYWISYIDLTYFRTPQISGSLQFMFSAVCLAYSSSALTPCVLVILSENFRVEAIYIAKRMIGQRAQRRVVPMLETQTRTQTQFKPSVYEVQTLHQCTEKEDFPLSPVAHARAFSRKSPTNKACEI